MAVALADEGGRISHVGGDSSLRDLVEAGFTGCAEAPKQRYAMPSELGTTAAYLASEGSRFVTVSGIEIDGDGQPSKPRQESF
jgi:NAD(P)-dependent dehydrogenase (short-subunit alcohol dehydrogenase family)